MRRFLLVFTILALCTMAGAGPDADALRAQIAARDKAIHSAVMKRDLDAYAKAIKIGIGKDFKCVEKGKTVSFDQMIDEMKDIFAAMPRMISEESIALSLVVKVKNGTATGTTEHKIKGSSMPDEDGVLHKVAFYGTSVETYRKTGGTWVLVKQV